MVMKRRLDAVTKNYKRQKAFLKYFKLVQVIKVNLSQLAQFIKVRLLKLLK